MKKIIMATIILVIIVIFLLLNQSTTQKLTITTTSYPIEFMIDQITGGTVEVENIYPQGADIHEYELTATDIQKILNSDYYIGISIQEEPFIKSIKKSIAEGESDVQVIEVAEDQLLTEQIDEEQYLDYQSEILKNYHLWVSPKKALLIAQIVYNNLLSINSKEEGLYTKNYNILKEDLEQIDKEYQRLEITKTIYVTHDAYYWLNEDYNFNIVGILSEEHSDEPSAKEMTEIISNINEQKIKYIYAEKNEENNNIINTIASQSEVQIGYLNNFEGKLEGEDYLQGLENNLEEMRKND